MEEMKLLSLFDGSGGFPLAASMCGITPVMAAEVWNRRCGESK